jgi:tetratricopeptide (TPR) repeat protein
MTTWKHYKEDWLLFTEAGFIAVNQADEDAALKLFKAGDLLNPENTLPRVGFGYLHLHKLELKQAVKIFEKIIEEEPKNEMARTFLGLCLGMMPNMADKGEKILEQTTRSDDPEIRSLSMTAIDFVEKFIKKSPGPAGKGKL